MAECDLTEGSLAIVSNSLSCDAHTAELINDSIKVVGSTTSNLILIHDSTVIIDFSSVNISSSSPFVSHWSNVTILHYGWKYLHS
jgi:hypothetical protein